jgi:hypothetical protein
VNWRLWHWRLPHRAGPLTAIVLSWGPPLSRNRRRSRRQLVNWRLWHRRLPHRAGPVSAIVLSLVPPLSRNRCTQRQLVNSRWSRQTPLHRAGPLSAIVLSPVPPLSCNRRRSSRQLVNSRWSRQTPLHRAGLTQEIRFSFLVHPAKLTRQTLTSWLGSDVRNDTRTHSIRVRSTSSPPLEIRVLRFQPCSCAPTHIA